MAEKKICKGPCRCPFWGKIYCFLFGLAVMAGLVLLYLWILGM